MSVLCELPDLAAKFEKLKIILDLRQKYNPKNQLSVSITNAIDCKEFTTDEIINFVKSQANDNPELMSECIGKELCNKIINL